MTGNLPQAVLDQLKACQDLRLQGMISEAIAYARSAVSMAPDDPDIRSHLLFNMQYDPAATPGTLLMEHRAYAAALPPYEAPPHPNPREYEKRINLGFVSADLHQHPVGYFMMPVLSAIDQSLFQVHAYYNCNIDDGVNRFLREHTNVWHDVMGKSHGEVEDLVRRDGIDILIDLNGHTGYNRLPVFARKPAPVQATWGGYFGTTGLPQMDYLIADNCLTPPGAERWVTERLVRLPSAYLCFAVLRGAPEVRQRPHREPGHVTFASFNNTIKINPSTIALWAKVLRAVPESTMLLKAKRLNDPEIVERFYSWFAAEGIPRQRVTMELASPPPEYMARYHDVDIVLDTRPVSGGTTTLDALWMGVPVITLPGETFASRHSLTYLTAADVCDFAAANEQAYVDTARQLACDPAALDYWRGELRDCVRRSTLVQAEDFTRGFERALRVMWFNWCSTGGQNG